MKKFAFISLLFLFSTISFTQSDTSQTRKFFPQEHGPKRWRLLLGLDAHRSFYAGYPVKFNGLRVGVEFKGVHRFGLGVYALKRNVVFTDIDIDKPDASDTSVVKFHVSFSSLFYERVFYKTRKWEVAIPAYLSAGTVKGLYQDTAGIFKEFVEKPFSSIGTGVQVKYYIWSWLAPKVSVGYRLTFNAEKEIRQAFNSPYYSFGISIGIGELYRTIFKNDEPRKKIRDEVEKGEVNEGE